MKTILIALLLSSSLSHAGEHKLGLGLFTEHYISDKRDYNENNRLISYTYVNDSRYTFTAASFENSHYIDSQILSFGYEFDFGAGVTISAIKGYEGYFKTHYEGVIFAPVFYFETYGFRHTIMGPAYNLAYVFTF